MQDARRSPDKTMPVLNKISSFWSFRIFKERFRVQESNIVVRKLNFWGYYNVYYGGLLLLPAAKKYYLRNL